VLAAVPNEVKPLGGDVADHDLHPLIVAAVNDFAGYLSTQPDFHVGETRHPEPLILRMKEWMEKRELRDTAWSGDWFSVLPKRTIELYLLVAMLQARKLA